MIMGRRRDKRLRIALPVTVSGHDHAGRAFTQSAVTVDLGPEGMRLRGVRGLGAPGDPVIVEYNHRRARYRLAWIGQKGTCWEGLAGLEGLEGARLLFVEHFPATMHSAEARALAPGDVRALPAATDHAATERRQQERRRYQRFTCAGTASIWQEGIPHPIGGRVNEISMGGCFIEMWSPIAVGASLRLELEVNSRTLRLGGVVRLSQPALGMGIEFTRISPVEAEKLHRVIVELGGQMPEQPAAPASAVHLDSAREQLGDAVLRWFGIHDVLTREQFLGILDRVKRAAEPATHV